MSKREVKYNFTNYAKIRRYFDENMKEENVTTGLRIAYLSIEFSPRIYGGLGTYVMDIGKILVSMHNQITVFTPNERDGSLPEYVVWEGIHAYRIRGLNQVDSMEPFISGDTLKWGSEGVAFLFDLLSYNHIAAHKLIEMNAKQKFDLCVAHDWLGLPACMTVKRETDLPTVFHVHSTEYGRSMGTPNQQIVNLELKGATAVDIVLTVSGAMKRELIEMGVPQEKIRVCHHAVDAEAFNPERVSKESISRLRKSYNFRNEEKVLLFLGRLEPLKGVQNLISAMPFILSENPDTKLIIVGKGSLESAIKEQVEKRGLRDKVTINTSFLDLDTKINHYALADLCVFPSFYEPFGIVALEASAMQKPLVVGARGTSGLREIVEKPHSDRATGCHINPYDPTDIAWGVNTIFSDPDLAARMGINARKRVLERFTWDIAARNTMKIYQEAVSLSH